VQAGDEHTDVGADPKHHQQDVNVNECLIIEHAAFGRGPI
jgi:hypothetical protein